MALTTEHVEWFAETFAKMVANVEEAVIGKKEVVQIAILAMISEGHLLLEDFPGTGKTSLARAIAQTLDGKQTRIQFTPDLLPSDVTGIEIFDQSNGTFAFHEGPVFANVVLADEINRASPKTQAALLEVMEENHVTVGGVTHTVSRPFMVIATQNPIEQAGTYRLPEAQLDRFLIKTSLGYPDRESTAKILGGPPRARGGIVLEPVVSSEHAVTMIDLAGSVYVDDTILDYVSTLLDESRNAPDVVLGCSVRAGLSLVRAAKTWAIASGREYVIPDDVQYLASSVLAHRLVLDPEEEFRGMTPERVIGRILNNVPAPEGSVA